MTEQNGERDALRAVYEAARRVLRFNSIDREQTLASIEALRDAIEQVKSIDAGYGDEFAPPTPEQAGPSGEALLRSALNAMLTQFGMDEDEWNKPTFDQARAALASPGAMEGAQAAQPEPNLWQRVEILRCLSGVHCGLMSADEAIACIHALYAHPLTGEPR